MKKVSMTVLVGASFVALCSDAVFSQEAARDGTFKGTLVCVAFPWQPKVVRAPMDLTVTDETIMFARPILGNNQISGTEMAKGAIDADGNFSVTSNGSEDGTRYEGKYKGAMTGDGGTLTGTQTWSRGDVTRMRICTGAFVRSRA